MPWEKIEEVDSSPDGAEFFWASIDGEVPAREFRLLDCQSCARRLRIPTTYTGRILCPACDHMFSSVQEEKVHLEPSESDQEDWDGMSTGGKVLSLISIVIWAWFWI
jgi:hypothetical protein